MENHPMKVVKIGEHNEVVLPEDELSRLGVKAGDRVCIRVERYEEFPYTDEPIGPETRAEIEEGLRDIREGRLGPELRNKQELHDYLDRLDKS